MTRRPDRRTAAAAVELAVLLPFLALVFSAVVDFARVLHATQMLQAAAAAGAVTASGAAWTPGYPNTAVAAGKAAAVAAAPGLQPPLAPDAVTVTLAGGRATVTVACDFPLATAVLVPSRTVRLERTTTLAVAPRPGD